MRTVTQSNMKTSAESSLRAVTGSDTLINFVHEERYPQGGVVLSLKVVVVVCVCILLSHCVITNTSLCLTYLSIYRLVLAAVDQTSFPTQLIRCDPHTDITACIHLGKLLDEG